jgi:propionyl-CoA synthetase
MINVPTPVNYDDFYHQSINQPDAFWTEQAKLIDWFKPFERVCNYDNPPFARWFEGGQTNLCHNAVDRHLKARPDQAALIAISTETGTEKTYTFSDLHREVQRMAASLKCAKGRSRVDLHADGGRCRFCDARLCAHWGHS